MIHLSANGEILGEFAEDAVPGLLSNGTITDAAYYWREGMADWLPVGELLAATAPKTPAKVTPPAAAVPQTTAKPAEPAAPSTVAEAAKPQPAPVAAKTPADKPAPVSAVKAVPVSEMTSPRPVAQKPVTAPAATPVQKMDVAPSPAVAAVNPVSKPAEAAPASILPSAVAAKAPAPATPPPRRVLIPAAHRAATTTTSGAKPKPAVVHAPATVAAQTSPAVAPKEQPVKPAVAPQPAAASPPAASPSVLGKLPVLQPAKGSASGSASAPPRSGPLPPPRPAPSFASRIVMPAGPRQEASESEESPVPVPHTGQASQESAGLSAKVPIAIRPPGMAAVPLARGVQVPKLASQLPRKVISPAGSRANPASAESSPAVAEFAAPHAEPYGADHQPGEQTSEPALEIPAEAPRILPGVVEKKTPFVPRQGGGVVPNIKHAVAPDESPPPPGTMPVPGPPKKRGRLLAALAAMLVLALAGGGAAWWFMVAKKPLLRGEVAVRTASGEPVPAGGFEVRAFLRDDVVPPWQSLLAAADKRAREIGPLIAEATATLKDKTVSRDEAAAVAGVAENFNMPDLEELRAQRQAAEEEVAKARKTLDDLEAQQRETVSLAALLDELPQPRARSIVNADGTFQLDFKPEAPAVLVVVASRAGEGDGDRAAWIKLISPASPAGEPIGFTATDVLDLDKVKSLAGGQ